MRTRPMLVLVSIALGIAATACADDDATSDSAPLVAPAPTDGPAPSTAPLTVAPTTEAGAAPSTDAVPTTDAAPTTAATPTPPAAVFPRTVEHAMGTTEIPAEPQRVVTLDMSFVDAALALETPIVGYTLYQDPDGDLPSYFGDALVTLAADAAYMGDLLEPNLEAIAAAQPDLILTSKVRHEAIYDELSAIAPTIMSESAGAGWKDNIRLTGAALGREAVADEVIEAYEARAAAVGGAVNAAAGDPTVSVVRFAALDTFRLYQRASFSGVVLDDAGLARPANQQATDPAQFITEVSFEELAQADAGADVLLLHDLRQRGPRRRAGQRRPLGHRGQPAVDGPAHRPGSDRARDVRRDVDVRRRLGTAPRPSSTTSPPRSVSTRPGTGPDVPADHQYP